MGKREGRLQLVRARIEEERVSGGRVERERALRLAYVVATHGLLAELEDEFRTIVDLEGLALRLKPGKRGGAGYLTMSLFNLVESMRSATHPILGTRATGARRNLFGGAQSDVNSVHAALSDLLAPVADVQIGDRAARNTRISEDFSI